MLQIHPIFFEITRTWVLMPFAGQAALIAAVAALPAALISINLPWSWRREQAARILILGIVSGLLLCYGTSLPDLWRRAAFVVDYGLSDLHVAIFRVSFIGFLVAFSLNEWMASKAFTWSDPHLFFRRAASGHRSPGTLKSLTWRVGDRETAARLVSYEQERDPAQTRKEAVRAAIRRLDMEKDLT